jgi:hypothetical protein
MWTSIGIKNIDMTVEDCDNSSGVGNGATVTIGNFIYLPLVLK